ncbi:uncharacterized protein C7orf50 homolog isoform X2 [Linepithema humile]|uniref:uncharacterized protein C7orf50 homolog isoform X2 n=1 Tax=Linepithema humile TaxID=83485 RepID=UPI0006232EB6|nr:PREDICTED: uncharacterized protein C7orf50 homolog isoform X2 [Linepithema humile]
MQIKEHRFIIRHKMDDENAAKIELRKSRKRNGEREKIEDTNMNNHVNNHHKMDKIFQNNIVQKKQTGKRKRKSIVQETESLSEKLEEANNVTIDEDTAKDANEKTSKKPSKRQLKKEKAIQREAQKKETNKINAMQKALNYVSMWKHSRSEWKFEKLRQIWLMDNLLDENSISDIIFPVVLEYFEGCKGMAREVLLRKGMEVIRKAEEEENEENKNEIMESIAYKRARQLLQTLPIDM